VRQTAVIPPRRRPSPWASLVAVSAVIVVGGALIIGVWWAATREERISSYAVSGSLNGVTLDLGDADADIVGGGEHPSVNVSRTDRSAFGRHAVTERDVSGGVLRIRSRCPSSVLGSCSASYRLTVPDNVPVTVRTGAGNVRFDRYKGSARIDTTGGDIAVNAFCGFALQARAESGTVRAAASCAPERMELRSATGDVRAVVPPGRYRVDADSDAGRRTVEGVTAADDAPFSIQALSGNGDVDVLGQP
jgi:Putative adhesin